MIRIILFVVFLLLHKTLAAQDHIIQVAPRCGQENLIKQLFAPMNLTQKEVYVLHFRPAACPRCESAIWTTTTLLKEQNEQVILVVDGDHQEKSMDYINNLKGITVSDFSQIIYDTNAFYHTIIDYKASFELAYPLLYKIDAHTGKFYSVNALAGASITNDWIQSVTDNKLFQDCKEVDPLKKTDATTTNTFWDDQWILSTAKIVSPRHVNANTKLIYFTDATTNHVLIYDRQGTLIQQYYPEEEELYIDVEEDTEYRKKIQQDFIDTGVAKVIYLNAYVDESGNTRIPASIPDIWYKGKESFYANAPLFIEKKRGSNSNSDLIRFESKVDFNDTLQPHSPFFVSHSYYQPFFKNYFAFPLYKGWPTRGYELDQNDFDNNPFDPKFYRDAQVLRVYKNNDEYTDIGSLPTTLIKNKLGYYYKISSYTASTDKLYVFDKFSGEVQIFDKKTIENQKNNFTVVQLFPEKLKQIDDYEPQLNADDPKINLLTAYNPIITASAIWDAKIDANQQVCVLIADYNNSQLIFKQYNPTMTQLLLEKRFPLENFDILESITIQFNQKQIAERIVGLEKIEGQFYLKFKGL